jgi:hypothetical protein
MNHAQKSDAASAVEGVAPAVRECVLAYWRDLGVTDPGLAGNLTDDCLARARRHAGRSDGELLRRALEEALRRFDHALGRALRLPPAKDAHAIAAARAAFLLNQGHFTTDLLFKGQELPPELAAALLEVLPRSTPPEVHLSMPATPLRFWLFKSTHPR